MHGYVERNATGTVLRRLAGNPAVALLGPRQVGKSTLAKHILSQWACSGVVYLDLERQADLRKLDDIETFLSHHAGKLVCIDEVQRRPELFSELRSVIDRRASAGQFLILGSASPALLRQSSESLAGRLAYVELFPFSPIEVGYRKSHWVRGGFPRSFLAASELESFEWRLDFVRTFLERDLAQMGPRLSPQTMRRLWQMVAHSHGQLLNGSKFGASLGVSHTTVRGYLDLLSAAFLVRLLPPHFSNTKKRLVRSPKTYVRDTGLLHALLGVDGFDSLAGHSVYGHSWEGHVIEAVLGQLEAGWDAGFYRTSHGAEIDLVLTRGGKRVAIECKASSAPKLARGFWHAKDDLSVDYALVVAPIDETYQVSDGVWVVPLERALQLAQRGFVEAP